MSCTRPDPHPDTPRRPGSEAPAVVTAFVALQDIDEEMGPTLFLPGTHNAAAHGALLEGDRAADFAPVKNAPGNADSPDTARALVSAAHGAEAGLSLPNFRTL